MNTIKPSVVKKLINQKKRYFLTNDYFTGGHFVMHYRAMLDCSKNRANYLNNDCTGFSSEKISVIAGLQPKETSPNIEKCIPEFSGHNTSITYFQKRLKTDIKPFECNAYIYITKDKNGEKILSYTQPLFVEAFNLLDSNYQVQQVSERSMIAYYNYDNEFIIGVMPLIDKIGEVAPSDDVSISDIVEALNNSEQ